MYNKIYQEAYKEAYSQAYSEAQKDLNCVIMKRMIDKGYDDQTIHDSLDITYEEIQEFRHSLES